jgi:ribosome maturation factor RimP
VQGIGFWAHLPPGFIGLEVRKPLVKGAFFLTGIDRIRRQAMAIADELTHQLFPLIEDLGYECVGVEYISNPKNRTVRVYIDSPNGIDVDDCETVSREISAWMDVEDPVSGEYSLEVSSPGIERPLFKPAHFEQFAGEQAEVSLIGPLVNAQTGQKQRVFKGVIGRPIETEQGLAVPIETQQGAWVLPLSQVQRAKLTPDIAALLKQAKSQRD